MVPLEPRQAPSVGRQSRRRIEVGARANDLRLASVERDLDERRHRLAWARVVLAHGEQAATRRVDDQVRVAPRAARRDRHPAPIGPDPVQPAVRERRDDDELAVDDVGRPAVLLDAVSNVHPRRADVVDRAVRIAPDERVPAAIVGPTLEPPDGAVYRPRLAQPDRVPGQQLDRERRCPGAVRGDGAIGRGGHVPCCQLATYSACSDVIESRVIPSAASLSRATSASIASGTT